MIILLTGKASSGKTTVANYLRDNYGFSQDSLAAPIKRLTADIFRIPEKVLDPSTKEDRTQREQPLEYWTGWTPRKLLQFIGTELFRNQIMPDIWVRSLWLRIADKNGNWVVSDVRFPNEQSFLAEHFPDGDVLTVKIVRPGCDGNVGLDGHLSESYDISADYLIHNDGDFANLYRQVDQIISLIITKSHRNIKTHKLLYNVPAARFPLGL